MKANASRSDGDGRTNEVHRKKLFIILLGYNNAHCSVECIEHECKKSEYERMIIGHTLKNVNRKGKM